MIFSDAACFVFGRLRCLSSPTTVLFHLFSPPDPTPLPNSCAQQASSLAEQLCEEGLLQFVLPATVTGHRSHRLLHWVELTGVVGGRREEGGVNGQEYLR